MFISYKNELQKFDPKKSDNYVRRTFRVNYTRKRVNNWKGFWLCAHYLS